MPKEIPVVLGKKTKKIKELVKKKDRKDLVDMIIIGRRCPGCKELNKIEMTFCGTCGHKLDKLCFNCLRIVKTKISGGGIFCTECKKIIEIRCPKCQTYQDPELGYCMNCGEGLNGTS